MLGNAMSLREFSQMLRRIQDGETTPAEEMATNLGISSPGEYSQDDIDRLYTDEGVPSE